MSDGPKKNDLPEDTVYITMDPEEFSEVCKRLNQMLSSRVERAWQKKSKKPSSKATKNHVEAAKDAFAFIHLMDLVEHMSQEIFELRQEVQVLSETDDLDDDVPAQIFAPPSKKSYLN